MWLPEHYGYFSYPSLEGWGYSARSYKREIKIKKTNSDSRTLRNNQMLTVIVSKVAKRRLQCD